MQADAVYSKKKFVFAGDASISSSEKTVAGEIISIGNEQYYRITNYDMMPPFMMNVVSSSDLWMFLSSTGSLTAGRKNPDNALFPYYTDDRIHDTYNVTGPRTIIFVTKDNVSFLWEPFNTGSYNIYNTERNIYKNLTGSKVIFEEVNYDLGLNYQYSWQSCDRFGFVLKSKLTNTGDRNVNINLLHGIQNILPPGSDRKFQLEYSTLLDGYKKNELLEEEGIALFTLSSIPTDKAEPAEALKAAAAWQVGLDDPVILLSSNQLQLFKRTGYVVQENFSNGTRGAFFVQSTFELVKGSRKEWYITADINKDHAGIAALAAFLKARPVIKEQLEGEITAAANELNCIAGRGDALQLTQDILKSSRHFSNVLFNILRGGIFDNNYIIDILDFSRFVKHANLPLWNSFADVFEKLQKEIQLQDLISAAEETGNADLVRLCYEYLPLTFSRRHGDPTRPWNLFSIDIKDELGNKILNYQGNWRDIFQNWEALALSYPGFIENMIVKFLNSSTADGYNPYKVTRNGFDWEVLDPSDSWSHIGYWGDHQVIYLLKLLELSDKYHPGKLKSLLNKEIFTYANVPYRIKKYADIAADPHNTIDFDFQADKSIRAVAVKIGTDAKYIYTAAGKIYYVNLAEKLLLPVLTKLSNFVPEAGIWLNTQRPEWNDANNALVGNGASMVTLYQLRKYTAFLIKILKDSGVEEIILSEEVSELLASTESILQEFKPLLNGNISDKDRKKICDRLGEAGSKYRLGIYSRGFTGNGKVSAATKVIQFLHTSLDYLDHSIYCNKRSDGLYHSYNLIKIDNGSITIRRLYEMLEGQVAVLGSGYLSVDDSISLLYSLRNSSLYREDQESYMLYPERTLSSFNEKNIIPEELLKKSQLLQSLLHCGDKNIVIRDVHGKAHFNSNFRNVRYLKKALEESAQTVTDNEARVITEIYEAVFDHQSFTGRSGTFYKYEGLGSIYWHMVSKLLVAIQDIYFDADTVNAGENALKKLKNIYYEIREGIGEHKSPDRYGAFPTDPHSHTPSGKGVQQPGMTGQVKEDIITRFGELGVVIKDGEIHFNHSLLKRNEFLQKSRVFTYYDAAGSLQTMMLSEGMLAFTICQVPVVYIQSEEERIIITNNDGKEVEIKSLVIGKQVSGSIFERTGEILKIEVLINK